MKNPGAIIGFLIVLLVSGVAMMGVGMYQLGHQEGYEDGRKSVDKVVKIGEANIDDVGAYRVDGFTINLTKGSKHPLLSGRVVGFTNNNKDIWLETNRSAYEIVETCQHEILHNTRENMSHDWIYENEDSVTLEPCIRLLAHTEVR